MAHRESPSKDELVLIPAIRKDSTTGYKCVNYNRGAKKFEAKVMDGGKRIFTTAPSKGPSQAVPLLVPVSNLCAVRESSS